LQRKWEGLKRRDERRDRGGGRGRVWRGIAAGVEIYGKGNGLIPVRNKSSTLLLSEFHEVYIE
jgi:hypothetical protein